MIELGQLEAHHEDFARRHARIVVVSLENEADARQTQTDFPHLVVVADHERKLINALDVLHKKAAPDGGDAATPTTVLVDRQGVVRWVFRPDRVIHRLSPEELLAAMGQHFPAEQ
jgi:peroxiredoxin